MSYKADATYAVSSGLAILTLVYRFIRESRE